MLGLNTIKMDPMKSHRGFYRELVVRLYNDIADCHKLTNKARRRDIAEMQRRFDSEGFSYFTKTLPSYGKALDKALSADETLSIPGLSTGKDGLPEFLGFLWRKVFMSDGHSILTEIAVNLPYVDLQALTEGKSIEVAVGHLRQFLYFAYKLEIPHDEDTENAVFETFAATDQGLPEPTDSPFIDGWGCHSDGVGLSGDVWLQTARGFITKVVQLWIRVGLNPDTALELSPPAKILLKRVPSPGSTGR